MALVQDLKISVSVKLKLLYNLNLEDKAMMPILKTRNSVPSIVDEFFGNNLLTDFWNIDSSHSVPSVNLVEAKDEYRIEVAAPGLHKEDFKINLNNDELTISSEKSKTEEKKEERYMRKEFSYTSFSRSFILPESVSSDKIYAEHKNGILNVHIPKKEVSVSKESRAISIS
jgi:HSP20 family protein